MYLRSTISQADASDQPRRTSDDELTGESGSRTVAGRNKESEAGVAVDAEPDEGETAPFAQTFAQLSDLPEDLAEAFESFKLAILRHKLGGWSEVGRDDVLASLDALKELAASPPTESTPLQT